MSETQRNLFTKRVGNLWIAGALIFLDRLPKLICTFQNTKAGSTREGVGISSKSAIVVDKAREDIGGGAD